MDTWNYGVTGSILLLFGALQPKVKTSYLRNSNFVEVGKEVVEVFRQSL